MWNSNNQRKRKKKHINFRMGEMGDFSKKKYLRGE